MGLRFVWCAFFVVNFLASKCEKPPHIIILMADDMGRNDVSYMGSNMLLTPNIDALAYNGMILNDFHSPSLCSPSRSSLLTGKFPINTGMQQLVILEAEPWGLPLSLKILPQYLNSVGYESHLVGKWHQGFFERRYMPTCRGFQSFFGFLQGHHDYYTHESHETYGDFVGYDLRDDMTPRKDLKNFYTCYLLEEKAVHLIDKHDPSKPLFLFLSHIAPHSGEQGDYLQAPADVIERFSYIPDEDKRKYAAMVSILDDCVGNVITSLNRKKMLENSIILFMSDNGAPTIGIYSNTGSNYPLRGMKATEFEGGTRVPACIWSPLFKNQQQVSNIMMHMADVLPTLCTAAGVPPKQFNNIDGISMWETLVKGSQKSLRTEFPYNINPAEPDHSVGAVRVGDWKFYQGDAKGNTEMFLYPGNRYANSLYEEFGYNTSVILESPTNKAIENVYSRICKRDAKGNTEMFLYPGNRYANSLYEEFVYNTSVVLEFFANKAIENVYSRICKISHRPLTVQKIEQLRSETKIVCPTLDHLPKCDATKSCLLNLKEDPCEQYDYSTQNPGKSRIMKRKYEEYRKKVVPPLNKPRDVCANPEYYDGVWVPWYDYDDVLRKLTASDHHFNDEN